MAPPTAADFFFSESNLSEDYEGILTKLRNAKRQSSMKMNALKTYLTKWNKKKIDEVLQVEKSMVWGKVASEIDAVRRIMVTIETYYDQIILTAEKLDGTHGLSVEDLRKQFDKLGQEIEVARRETLGSIEDTLDSLIGDSKKYAAEDKPSVMAPSLVQTPAMVSFRPLEELSPGEISPGV